MKNKKSTVINKLQDNVNIVGDRNDFCPVVSDKKREKILSIIKSPSQGLSEHEKLLFAKSNDGFTLLVPKISEERKINLSMLIPAPSEWNFFGMPDQESYGILLKSIIVYGLFNPITVWEQNDGKYMILAGHTRESCYRELYEVTGDEKYSYIPCKIYHKDDITPDDARRIIVLSNIGSRAKESPRTRVKCMSVLASLAETERHTDGKVDVLSIAAKALGYSRVMAFHYRNISRLIEPLFEMFADGEISVRNAITLSSLNQHLQEYIYTHSYTKKITGNIRKLLKNAKTVEDIEKIFSDDKSVVSYDITLNLPYEKPDKCSFLPLFIRYEEIEQFCTLLERKEFPLPEFSKQIEYFRNLARLDRLKDKKL